MRPRQKRLCVALLALGVWGVGSAPQRACVCGAPLDALCDPKKENFKSSRVCGRALHMEWLWQKLDQEQVQFFCKECTVIKSERSLLCHETVSL